MTYDPADDVFIECLPDDYGPNFIAASWDAVAIRPIGRWETHFVEIKPNGYLFHVEDYRAWMSDDEIAASPGTEVERVFVPTGTTGVELRETLRPNGRADLSWLPERVTDGYEYVRFED